MSLPTPLRQLCWLGLVVGLIILLYGGVSANSAKLLLIGFVMSFVCGVLSFFFGHVDDS